MIKGFIILFLVTVSGFFIFVSDIFFGEKVGEQERNFSGQSFADNFEEISDEKTSKIYSWKLSAGI
jgi:hypothetical protein